MRPARPSLRRYFDQHPGLAAGISLAAVADVAGISVKWLLHARVSVHTAWLPAVGAGLAASLTVLRVPPERSGWPPGSAAGTHRR